MEYIKNLMRKNKEVGFFDCMLLRKILMIKLNKAREEGRKELLTQPQAEEKPVTVAYMGEEVVAGTDKSIKKHKKDMEDFIKGKSTTGQREEWEEELGKLMSTWGKVLFVNKGRIGAGMQTAMYLKFYHFIKNLLSEREREVVETIKEIIDVKSIYQENGNECGTPLELIEWYVDTELDKLNKKK